MNKHGVSDIICDLQLRNCSRNGTVMLLYDTDSDDTQGMECTFLWPKSHTPDPGTCTWEFALIWQTFKWTNSSAPMLSQPLNTDFWATNRQGANHNEKHNSHIYKYPKYLSFGEKCSGTSFGKPNHEETADVHQFIVRAGNSMLISNSNLVI